MLVYAFCPRCKITIPIKTSAITRSELEDERGLYLDVSCQKCGTKHNFHVNRINAKVSPKGLILAVILSSVFSILLIGLLYLMGFWSILTLTLPIVIVYFYQNTQAKEARNFNRIKINRK